MGRRGGRIEVESLESALSTEPASSDIDSRTSTKFTRRN